MKKKISALFILIAAIVLLPAGNAAPDANTTYKKKMEIVSVEQWDVVPAGEVNIPNLTKTQLLAEVQKYINVHKAFRSWEAEYRVTWRQAHQVTPRTLPSATSQDLSVPETVIKTEAKIISNGNKWFYKSKEETEYKTANSKSGYSGCYTSNGKSITMLWPDDRTARVQQDKKDTSISSTTTVVDFLPWLPAEQTLAHKEFFPDILKILTSPDAELLLWCTKVNGHTCYVIEQTTTSQCPLFRTSEELEEWKRNNPKEPEPRLIEPSAKPGDLVIEKTITRLAIDPEFGFAIVRCSKGFDSNRPRFRIVLFPSIEIKYGNFRRFDNGIYISREMAYTEYNHATEGQKNVRSETALQITNFAINKTYPQELFKPEIPKGYHLMDIDRGIQYTVGDSKEKIDALLAAAQERDSFYAKLSDGLAPSLEASQWFNSKPISMSDNIGREIILHYWAIGCGACMSELPSLQRQYGGTAQSSSHPLFISIHPFVEGENLQQLKDTIKKYNITFPVMVDSQGDKRWPIGKTSKKYKVYSWPTNIKINNNGHFAEIENKISIDSTSWWVNKADSNSLLYKK